MRPALLKEATCRQLESAGNPNPERIILDLHALAYFHDQFMVVLLL